MWEFLDKIIYINLDYREDRRKLMKDFFKEGQIPDNKIIRFPAIQHEVGSVGASYSHIHVLQLAKNNNWKNVLILEDDVEWVNFEENYKKIERLMKEDWDVFMIGGTYVDKEELRVKIGYSGYSYIVREHYYHKLIKNLKDGLQLKLNKNASGLTKLIRDKQYNHLVKKDTFHSFDSYWMKLQWKDNWIGISACKHIHTYSDVSLSNHYEDIESTVSSDTFKKWIEIIKPLLENGSI
jgi:glycosyl transferase family 25